MELKRKFTGINEAVRQVLDITRDEYAYCAYVLYRQADTRQKLRGWCCDTKEQLAHFVGISRPGLYKMTDRMVKAGLLEVDAPTGFLCVTPYFIDIENECKQGLQNEFEQSKETVNLVYTDCKQSLHKNGNSVNLVTHNIGIERVNKKEEERNIPQPGKPDAGTSLEKPNESKKDFTKQTVEEQLREVWLYANKQAESIEAEKINPDEKRIKLERIETVKLALLSKDFRELIERYREYRKTMKYGWYKSDATLYATVANLAILAGTITERGEKKINIAHAREIYDFSAMLKNYRSFVKLPEYLQTPKETRNYQTPAPTPNYKPTRRMSEIADLDAPL